MCNGLEYFRAKEMNAVQQGWILVKAREARVLGGKI